MSSPSSKFKCPGCDKSYQWTPQVAGRKTKCKQCATVFSLPDTQPLTETVRAPLPPPPVPPPVPPVIEDWPEFPVSPPPPPPSVEPPAVSCPACGTAHLWTPEAAGQTFGCSNAACLRPIPFPPFRPGTPAYTPPPPPPRVREEVYAPPAEPVDEPTPRAKPKPKPSKRERERDVYALDRAMSTRWPMHNYFAPRPLWPYLLCAVAAVLLFCSFSAFLLPRPKSPFDDEPPPNPFLAWGACMIPVLLVGGAGAAGVFLLKIKTLSDGEAERLIERDRDALEAAAEAQVRGRLAQSFGGAVAGSLPGLAEPICFRAPTVRPKADQESELAWVYGFDGELRYACSNVMAVGAAGYRVVVVTLSIDHTTGMVYRSNLCEVQYQDIASVETVVGSELVARGLAARLARNRLWGPIVLKLANPKGLFAIMPVTKILVGVLDLIFWNDRAEMETTTFRVTTAGGNHSDVTLDVTYFDTITPADTKLNREETNDEAVLRNRIQEVKTLLRQPADG